MKGYEALPVEQCGACAHFRRHYIRCEGDHYYPISYGHCVFPRIKKRREENAVPIGARRKEALSRREQAERDKLKGPQDVGLEHFALRCAEINWRQSIFEGRVNHAGAQTKRCAER